MTDIYNIRNATPGDELFLKEMCYLASYPHPDFLTPSFEATQEEPWFSEYVDDWGRPGDFGLIAVSPDHLPVGAAWVRNYAKYVGTPMPRHELSLAVLPKARRQHLGTRLLFGVMSELNRQRIGEVCLQVADNNPEARALYVKLGFVVRGRVDNFYDVMVAPTAVAQ